MPPEYANVFCQGHWDELVDGIKEGEVNGISLQPLAIEAVLHHGEVLDEYDTVPMGAILQDYSPLCCWLDERSKYADGDEFRTDYDILIEAGSTPLDELPDDWWAEKGEQDE